MDDPVRAADNHIVGDIAPAWSFKSSVRNNSVRRWASSRVPKSRHWILDAHFNIRRLVNIHIRVIANLWGLADQALRFSQGKEFVQGRDPLGFIISPVAKRGRAIRIATPFRVVPRLGSSVLRSFNLKIGGLNARRDRALRVAEAKVADHKLVMARVGLVEHSGVGYGDDAIGDAHFLKLATLAQPTSHLEFVALGEPHDESNKGSPHQP